MNEILPSALGVLIGALVTMVFARIYYEKASRELAEEAAKLRHQSTLLLRGLEKAGFVKYSRDADGEHKGIIHEGKAHFSSGPSSMKGEGIHTPNNGKTD